VGARSAAVKQAWIDDRARRRKLALVAAVVVLAGGFALRMSLHDPNNGVLGVYLIAILLVAVEWGPRPGLATAAVAFGLFVLWAQIESVDFGPLGYLTRAAAFFPFAVLVGVGAQRLRAAIEEGSRVAGRQRRILETAEEAFIASDRRGVIREWNPAAERTFGWSADEAIGRLLPETVVPPRMREGYWRGLRHYLETGEGPLLGQRVEIKAVRRDGKEIPIELSLWATGEGEDWISYGFMHDISEREELERRLRESARYFELSHDLVSTATMDGRFEQLNRRWEVALGWTLEELRGKPFVELVHPDDQKATRRETERLARGGESVGRNRYRAKDGSWHWLEWSCVGVPEEGRIYATARDVTDRVEAEQASQRLGAIVESSRDAIYSYTLEGEIASWNEAAERLFGYTADEAIGMSVSDLVPPDRPDDAAAALERVSHGEVVEDRDTERMGQGGRRLEVSLTVSPVTDADGRVIGAATIARDISDRKRTWRYLSAQYRATRVLADAPEIAKLGGAVLPIVCDAGRWTCGAYWGAAGGDGLRCEATWVAPHLPAPVLPVQEGAVWEPGPISGVDPMGEPLWVSQVEPDSSLPCAEHASLGGLCTALWMPVQTAGKLYGAFQFFDRRERGEDKELLSVLSAIAGQISNFVERRRAEEATERMKTEFLGLVSHELRTPLTSIVGYTELLGEIEGDQLSEQGRKFLEVIERNARRELRLVGDLLLLVRIQSGNFAIEPGRADLREIVEQAIQAARPTAERQGVELSLQTEPVPDCEGDAHRLGQVMDNLLTNAIKFSPDGGEVTVRLARRNGAARIEVSDTGMGIAPEDREKLFQRLYRTKGATDMQIPGTGLGLSIVKAIVDAHGGAVDVESEVGAGTTFRVEIPLDAHAGDGIGPPNGPT
jgi:PAS domain S-box-containing protein